MTTNICFLLPFHIHYCYGTKLTSNNQHQNTTTEGISHVQLICFIWMRNLRVIQFGSKTKLRRASNQALTLMIAPTRMMSSHQRGIGHSSHNGWYLIQHQPFASDRNIKLLFLPVEAIVYKLVHDFGTVLIVHCYSRYRLLPHCSAFMTGYSFHSYYINAAKRKQDTTISSSETRTKGAKGVSSCNSNK